MPVVLNPSQQEIRDILKRRDPFLFVAVYTDGSEVEFGSAQTVGELRRLFLARHYKDLESFRLYKPMHTDELMEG